MISLEILMMSLNIILIFAVTSFSMNDQIKIKFKLINIFIMESNDKVKLHPKGGKEILVSRKAGEMSILIKNNLADFSIDQAIPLDEVNEETCELIVQYLSHYDGKAPEEIEKPLKSNDMKQLTDAWAADYVDKLELNKLIDLTTAANFMEIQSLLDICTAKIATLVKDKTEEEIFKTFGVEDNFTEEERMKVKEENKWLEDNI
jgi:S-phase kinase-associated protein 1